ncbi:MAG: NUDIX hydrolase [Thermoleophilia bacterium]|nr:NUDIX hydrolase [Thermoleophilia bacterium]
MRHHAGAPSQAAEGFLDPPARSERVYDGRIFRLRVSAYARDDGTEVTREVLDHDGAVAMIPIEDDHVLMVRQPREAIEEVMLELPAGKLDVTDTDPLSAARRELAEEVGRRAARWEYLGGFYVAPAMLTEFIHLYIATDLEPFSLEADEDERIEVVRVPLSAIPGVIERSRDAKTLIGLLRLARLLGI